MFSVRPRTVESGSFARVIVKVTRVTSTRTRSAVALPLDGTPARIASLRPGAGRATVSRRRSRRPPNGRSAGRSPTRSNDANRVPSSAAECLLVRAASLRFVGFLRADAAHDLHPLRIDCMVLIVQQAILQAAGALENHEPVSLVHASRTDWYGDFLDWPVLTEVLIQLLCVTTSIIGYL